MARICEHKWEAETGGFAGTQKKELLIRKPFETGHEYITKDFDYSVRTNRIITLSLAAEKRRLSVHRQGF